MLRLCPHSSYAGTLTRANQGIQSPISQAASSKHSTQADDDEADWKDSDSCSRACTIGGHSEHFLPRLILGVRRVKFVVKEKQIASPLLSLILLPGSPGAGYQDNLPIKRMVKVLPAPGGPYYWIFYTVGCKIEANPRLSLNRAKLPEARSCCCCKSWRILTPGTSSGLQLSESSQAPC